MTRQIIGRMPQKYIPLILYSWHCESMTVCPYIPSALSQWQDSPSTKCHKNIFHWHSLNGTTSQCPCATKIYSIGSLSSNASHLAKKQKYIPLIIFQWHYKPIPMCHKNIFHWSSFNGQTDHRPKATKIYSNDTLSMAKQTIDQMPQKYIPMTLSQWQGNAHVPQK